MGPRRVWQGGGSLRSVAAPWDRHMEPLRLDFVSGCPRDTNAPIEPQVEKKSEIGFGSAVGGAAGSVGTAVCGAASSCRGAVVSACCVAAGALSTAASAAGPVPGLVVGAAVNGSGAIIGAAGAGGLLLLETARSSGGAIVKAAGPIVGMVSDGTAAVLGAGKGVVGAAGSVLGDVASKLDIGGAGDAAAKAVRSAFKDLEGSCEAHPKVCIPPSQLGHDGCGRGV